MAFWRVGRGLRRFAAEDAEGCHEIHGALEHDVVERRFLLCVVLLGGFFGVDFGVGSGD